MIAGETAEEDQTVMVGAEGYVISIENPLILGQERTVLTWIFDTMSTITARPFYGDIVSNPLVEFMDLAVIVDRRGRSYQTVITDVSFVFLGYTTIKNSFDNPLSMQASYGSETAKVMQYARKLVSAERTSRETAVEQLAAALAAGSGMYRTEEAQDDGSIIYYLHDKPTLAESQNVLKITSEAIGFSNDGGKTYPGGITFNAETVMKIIETEGLKAEWVKVGSTSITDVLTGVQDQMDEAVSNISTLDTSVKVLDGVINGTVSESGETKEGLVEKVAAVTQTANGLNTTVSELSKSVANKAEASAVTSLAKTVSEVEQLASSITLKVTGADGNVTSIKISDGTINLTGEVLAQRIAVATLVAKGLLSDTAIIGVTDGIHAEFTADGRFVLCGYTGNGDTIEKLSFEVYPYEENNATPAIIRASAGLQLLQGDTQIAAFDYNNVVTNRVLRAVGGLYVDDSGGLVVYNSSGATSKISASDTVLNGTLTVSGGTDYVIGDTTYLPAATKTYLGSSLLSELLAAKAPSGYGYGDKMTYYDVQDGTFETTLDSILSGMVSYSAKQIQFYDPVDLIANKFIGTLWKYSNNYATLEAVSYSGYKAIKRKQGGTWQPWEWENPPMLPGVEYRTTERSNGSVVYRKMVEYTNENTFGEAGTMTTVQIAHGISKFGGLIRSACRHGNYYPVPAFTSAGYTLAVVEVSTLNITLRTNAAWTSRTWYFDLAYTKTS